MTKIDITSKGSYECMDCDANFLGIDAGHHQDLVQDWRTGAFKATKERLCCPECGSLHVDKVS